MSLKEQLEQAKAVFKGKVPEEAQNVVFSHIRQQRDSGYAFGLKEGDKAPDFTLPNPLGETVSLSDELAKGPAILVFYRGSWCPYCNIQLRAYQHILPEIRELGGRLIAISPQSPDDSLTQKEKEGLTFHVLSDLNGEVAARYNLLFELPDSLRQIFQHTFKLDLTLFNRTERWVLPVPATFLIDRGGAIRHGSVNPDFMDRMEPQDVLEQLKRFR